MLSKKHLVFILCFGFFIQTSSASAGRRGHQSLRTNALPCQIPAGTYTVDISQAPVDGYIPFFGYTAFLRITINESRDVVMGFEFNKDFGQSEYSMILPETSVVKSHPRVQRFEVYRAGDPYDEGYELYEFERTRKPIPPCTGYKINFKFHGVANGSALLNGEIRGRYNNRVIVVNGFIERETGSATDKRYTALKLNSRALRYCYPYVK